MTTSKEISRQDRISLACGIYGLYTLGLAVTDSDKVDEDCAMDNMGVPRYEDQLTEQHKKKLEEYNTPSTGTAAMMMGFMVEFSQKKADNLSQEHVAALIKIINKRRARIRYKSSPSEGYEVIPVNEDPNTGFEAEDAVAIGAYTCHATAIKEMEAYTARQIYADILVLQYEAINKLI